jgi:hypothetical protein
VYRYVKYVKYTFVPRRSQPSRPLRLETGTGDVFAEWAELSWMVWNLWPDTAADVGAADRAIARLCAAFTATAVDVAAVHREMLAVDAFWRRPRGPCASRV